MKDGISQIFAQSCYLWCGWFWIDHLFYLQSGVQRNICVIVRDLILQVGHSLIHLNSGHLNPHPQCSQTHWAEQIVIPYYILPPPLYWWSCHTLGAPQIRCCARPQPFQLVSDKWGSPRLPTFTNRIEQVLLTNMPCLAEAQQGIW